MSQKKRSRSLVILTILSLFLVIPLATACGEVFGVMVSTNSSGTVDGVDYDPEDILLWQEGIGWSMFFDGSDYDLETGKHDIEAFAMPYIFSDTIGSDTRVIFMSFYQNKVQVDGLGQVMGQDVVQFTETISGSYDYEPYFDGSDVGLSTTSEKIDGLDVLDGIFAAELTDGECQAVLSISTLGTYSIPAKYVGLLEGPSVKLTGDGSDLLLFCATNLGADTAGFWVGYFDGDYYGMPKNYTDSLGTSFPFEWFTLTTPGAFNVDDAFGGHSEIYGWDGGFFGPEFSAAEEGLDAYVDAFHIPVCIECGPPGRMDLGRSWAEGRYTGAK